MAEVAVHRTQRRNRASAGGDEADRLLDLRVGEDPLVEADDLEDPQDFVVDDRRPRQRVGLLGLVDGDRPHAEVPEQQGEQLADRPESADQDVGVHQIAVAGTASADTRLVSVPMPSISSSTVWPGAIHRSISSPQQPGIVPVEITSPASRRSPRDA